MAQCLLLQKANRFLMASMAISAVHAHSIPFSECTSVHAGMSIRQGTLCP